MQDSTTPPLPIHGLPWQPTCSMPMLQIRATMLAAVRTFFSEQNYLEVETPLLSHDVVIDAHLEPFRFSQSDDAAPLYLQTSPEAGMKRLLAAGSGSIFQITRSFRRGEQGNRHNSEFTMVEWYGVNTSWQQQMELTETLVRACGEAINAPARFDNQSFLQTAYDAAFPIALNGVLNLSVNELRQLAAKHTSIGNVAFTIDDRDDLLNILLAECVEPQLGNKHPEFLYDYPQTQAALAEINPADPRTACRFELYIDGLEICNGYQELTDADELLRRDQRNNASRETHSSAALPGARLMAAAMRSGLPACSGVALGFDRLLMALTGRNSIADVTPFPGDRA